MSVFKGLKVIDAASFIAAPGAATILSDFGAEVVKIEPPVVGDGLRKVFGAPNQAIADHNFIWTMAARNRRGLALDLKSPDAAPIVEALVREADVFITNLPLRQRPRLGIDYAQLAAINPRLIYASFTGYGERGAEMHKPGFDAQAFWARSGLADLVRPDAEGPPAAAANGMGDQPSGVSLYAAIVTALYRRSQTGEGGMVESSLIANGAWANAMSIQAALVGGDVVYRQPRETPRNALTNMYACADGRWFIVSLIAEDKAWPSFIEILGVPELAQDARFATRPARHANAAALTRILDGLFAIRPSDEWQTVFEAAGHTVGVVARSGDALHDLQMREAGAIIEGDANFEAKLTIDSPFHIDGLDKTKPRSAPEIGQDTDAILAGLGFAPPQIAEWRARGVVA
ncbi:CoA transferase [Sphingomonas naphthae]|uniref:CoA transferase n=1 Tax=Sphingomonas naphthae TaxID=1813468 RepID=A0ABY7TGJ1_9SPHN|nr:CoA transferase [Sphingomonas naphthae]WCT72178.1 CoA transferase [Sphingomonas naphthae]